MIEVFWEFLLRLLVRIHAEHRVLYGLIVVLVMVVEGVVLATLAELVLRRVRIGLAGADD